MELSGFYNIALAQLQLEGKEVTLDATISLPGYEKTMGITHGDAYVWVQFQSGHAERIDDMEQLMDCIGYPGTRWYISKHKDQAGFARHTQTTVAIGKVTDTGEKRGKLVERFSKTAEELFR
jgi:hypothetical protein